MLVRYVYFLCLVFFVSVCLHQSVYSQCTSPINAFPYAEGFELNNGNWTRSSTAHWQWGAIIPGGKSVITAAANGSKCWIVGGLSGATYSGGNSFLTSPCFDFTSLTNPEISFQVLWETEDGYDGVNMQYSTDQGNTWSILGSISSNSNCVGVNWYNSSSIRFLGNNSAWSGSVLSGGCMSGNGIGQWVIAKHNLSMLAGRNKVIFRFEFGAGTRCNDYEGFAIDDVTIQQAPPVTNTNFTYSCQGNRNVSFTNSTAICQTNTIWNFGDLASGSNNTSTLTSPNHLFSAPGIYNVTQTINFSSGPPVIHQQTINILGVTTTIVKPISCNGGNDGSIQAIANGGNGIYTYSWNTNPVQVSAVIANLSANTYTVNVTSTNACPTSSSIALTDPSKISIQTTPKSATCNLNNGSINTSVSGGSNAYIYQWSNGQSSQNLTNLIPGSYNLQITDAHGCTANATNIVIDNLIIPVAVFLGDDVKICEGKSLLLQPGNYTTYLWQDNSTAPTYVVTNSGTYSLEVSNAAGCKATDEIKITVDECKGVFFPSSFSPNNDRLNDEFGPIGDIGSLKNFSLSIYNRWGQLVFKTTNPYKKWDGRSKGRLLTMQVLVWESSYMLYSEEVTFKKGTIIAIE